MVKKKYKYVFYSAWLQPLCGGNHLHKFSDFQIAFNSFVAIRRVYGLVASNRQVN